MKTKDEFKVGKHGIGYIYSDFFDFVDRNSEFEKAENVGTFKKLEHNMFDHEIELQLKPVLLTLGDIVAFMDDAPEECKDGYANIFYLEGCVVRVSWSADGREWYVYAWRRCGDRLSAGGRVFSLATSSQTTSTELSDSLPLELTINGHTYVRKTV